MHKFEFRLFREFISFPYEGKCWQFFNALPAYFFVKWRRFLGLTGSIGISCINWDRVFYALWLKKRARSWPEKSFIQNGTSKALHLVAGDSNPPTRDNPRHCPYVRVINFRSPLTLEDSWRGAQVRAACTPEASVNTV